MTERKRKLASHYNRLDDQITEPVIDSIVIYPRSHSKLHVPGEHSTRNRQPATG
jgi:hypothetical protein